MRSNPEAAWYDVLTEEEAQEVAALEAAIENIKAALNSLSVRRGVIQRRANARVQWRRSRVNGDHPPGT